MIKMIIISLIMTLSGIAMSLPITQALTRSDLIISMDQDHTQFNTIKIG